VWVRAMTNEEIQKIAHDAAELAAKKAVRETLTALGINGDNPLEFQEQMHFVRTLRSAAATVGRQTLTVMIGAIVMGVLWSVWGKIGGPPK
jgi:hypothetical protein